MKLNLGCGTDLRTGWVNVDSKHPRGRYMIRDVCWLEQHDWIMPDIQNLLFIYMRIENFLSALPHECTDEILLDNVLEHLNNVPLVLRELHRVCTPDARITIRVPHVESKGAHLLTHTTLFSEESLRPFTSTPEHTGSLESEPLFAERSRTVTRSHPFAWHMRRTLGFDLPIGRKQSIEWVLIPQ